MSLYTKYKDLPSSSSTQPPQVAPQTPQMAPQMPQMPQMAPQMPQMPQMPQQMRQNPNLNNNNLNINNNPHINPPPTPTINSNKGIIEIENIDQKINLIHQNKVCVVDIYADWCGPCKQIAGRYEELSRKYSRPGVCAVAKENVDKNIKNVSLFPEAKGVPFFQFFKNGVFNTSIVGADIKAVEQKIVELINS